MSMDDNLSVKALSCAGTVHVRTANIRANLLETLIKSGTCFCRDDYRLFHSTWHCIQSTQHGFGAMAKGAISRQVQIMIIAAFGEGPFCSR